MTESEWLECDDPIAMIEHLRGNPTGPDTINWWRNRWQLNETPTANDRRFRLFACTCCRRVWNEIPEAVNREAVVAVEAFLEGQLLGSELQSALVASSAVEHSEEGRRTEPGYWIVKFLGRGFYKMTAAVSALLVTSHVISMIDQEYGHEARIAFDTSFYTGDCYFLTPFQWPTPIPIAVSAERTIHADLLRDIFGNPFRPVTLDPRWLSSTVIDLARTIYDEFPQQAGGYVKMPILADALMDAGCDSDEIIDHCRGPGPHVRGCWVVDLLTGRE